MKKAQLITLAVILACAPIASASAQQKTAAVSPSVRPTPAAAARQVQAPQPEAQLMMIRSTIAALNHANMTNNYSVLASLGAPGFQAANPPTRLAQTFTAFRSNNIDLSPTMLINPRLTQAASIVDGRLRLVGLFPSQPMQVNYDLQFEPANGQWRLHQIAVNLQAVPRPVEPAKKK